MSNDTPTSGTGQSLGLSLLVIATAQLMLVLDDSIANIALPTIQNELAISAANLPWLINAFMWNGMHANSGRSMVTTPQAA